jgi:3-oxoacyl-[acyl-carrier-protein] synthase II
VRRRVAVTGVGAITPLGNDAESMWDNLLLRQSGIDAITHFDASSFPTRIAAEVRDFCPAEFLSEDLMLISDRRTAMCLACAKMAVSDADMDLKEINPGRFGVAIGAESGRIDLSRLLEIHQSFFKDGRMDTRAYGLEGMEMLEKNDFVRMRANLPATLLSYLYNARSRCLTISSACTSGAQAVGEAMLSIRDGEADVMLAGGTSADVDVYALMGFSLLGALSRNENPKEASRPFDAKRDGFVLGEGAGVILLEEMNHAQRRGARIYGELRGFASSNDAYRITDPREDGRGACLAMRNAMIDAGVDPEDIDYINAHGTSTPMNDRAETSAVKKCFGERAYHIPVSSTKSAMGHAIAASGVLELIITLFATRENIIPPTLNYEHFDPLCDLDYAADGPRKAEIRLAMSNSFGFGGSNVSIVAGDI